MSVLIDTPIWSLALRRQSHHRNPTEEGLVQEWIGLVKAGRAHIIGPIRQELLSGVRRAADFELLREQLASFGDIPLITSDFEEAARYYNRCQTKGVSGTPIDLLLCAVAQRLSLAIFTTDGDFARYHHLLDIRLHNHL